MRTTHLARHRSTQPILYFDLDKPSEARRFLKGYRNPQGGRLQWVKIKDPAGKTRAVWIKDATDAEAVEIATQLYLEFYENNVGCYVEEGCPPPPDHPGNGTVH